MIRIAAMLALRAACKQRQVGCVLTDERGRLVGAGYNGRPAGAVNCVGTDACAVRCEGLHAEINALLYCENTDYVATAYITTAPCWHCVKALLATPCMVIVAARCELDADQEAALRLWAGNNRVFKWAAATGFAPDPR